MELLLRVGGAEFAKRNHFITKKAFLLWKQQNQTLIRQHTVLPNARNRSETEHHDILEAESGETLEIDVILNYDSKVWCFTLHKKLTDGSHQMRAVDVQV